MSIQPFLCIVFPDTATKPALAALGRALIPALTAAAGSAPLVVQSKEQAVVLLVVGEHGPLTCALADACNPNDRWLLARVGAPCAATGLNVAEAWIRRHAA